ncbi:BON domain-containing protein [Rickettsiaceae bacterium]|nr:BON domain-containing protein [Rickettsiaceae bacterium]
MHNLYIRILLITTMSLSLSSCLESIFAGTAGSALEFAKDRPVGNTLSDARISASIKTSFIKRNFRELYSKIKIEVVNGRVLLTGTIDHENDAISAVQIAWDQKGVNEVISEIKIDENSSNFDIVQYTRDTLITAQIKSKTIIDRDIKFVNYTVITLNDIVYLFGIARSEEELQKVANIAANIHSVKKVVSHAKVEHMANKVKPDSSRTRQESAFLIDQDDEDLNLDNGI